MNILCTSSINQQYVQSFDQVLNKFAKVSYQRDLFFKKSGDFDYVMINWPEELLGWGNTPTTKEILLIKEALDYWSSVSKIIVTMHNEVPHTMGLAIKKVSDLVYRSAHFIIHLGESSVAVFDEKYNNSSVKHLVIPHVKLDYINNISRLRARKSFGFTDKDVVVLVFGSIRKKEEYLFIKKVFEKWPQKNKKLLISRYRDFSIRPIRYIKKHLTWIDRKVIKNKVRVEDNEVQNYFKACDVVFIPRLDTLNSGIIPVAAFFDSIAIGGNIGNIEGALKYFNYPVFDVENINSAVDALDEAYSLSQSDHGLLARKILIKNCSPDVISKTLESYLS